MAFKIGHQCPIFLHIKTMLKVCLKPLIYGLIMLKFVPHKNH